MAKVLYLDIETSPNVADVWGLYDQNIGLSQLKQPSRIIGFAYKWQGKGKARWIGEYNRDTGLLSDRQQMIDKAHELLDQADVVVTYNGDKFDLKVLNTMFITEGMTPPSPVLSLDLYKTVSRNFKFPSKKLAYVADVLIGDTKIQNGGHVLWRHCLDPDVHPDTRRKGWALMARYCRQDVDLLEPLHKVLEPWLPGTTNFALLNDSVSGCRKCGSEKLVKRGFAHTATRTYQRYQCTDCGGWSRGSKVYRSSINT